AVITAKLLSIYRHKQTGMLNIQKRRKDACAVRKLARNTMSVFRGFRTKCFWSAMRPRIAFMGTNVQLFLCDLEDRTKHAAFDAQSGPFVADERRLATNATKAATSSVIANRCRSELGRAVLKNSFSTCAGVTPLLSAILTMNSSTPSERVGPARIEFTVTPVPVVVSAKPRASATCIVFVTP